MSAIVEKRRANYHIRFNGVPCPRVAHGLYTCMRPIMYAIAHAF